MVEERGGERKEGEERSTAIHPVSRLLILCKYKEKYFSSRQYKFASQHPHQEGHNQLCSSSRGPNVSGEIETEDPCLSERPAKLAYWYVLDLGREPVSKIRAIEENTLSTPDLQWHSPCIFKQMYIQTQIQHIHMHTPK